MKFQTLGQWLDWQTELHSQSIDMGLDRIRPVFSRLVTGPLATKVIVVAGTNGKGSTVAFLESLYVSGGYRVGSYTSPHLINYNERIRIQGEPVSDAQLCQAFDHVEDARANISLTYFEFGTLAAFDVFQNQKPNDILDVVILEVGLGGRLDAVNLIDADVAVITNIQLDHTDWLGDTREKIAIEKLGIARKGKPLIIADDDLPENVLPWLQEQLREQNQDENEFPYYLLGEDFGFTHKGDGWDWWLDVIDQRSKQKFRQQKHSLPLPALRGAHQFKNAAAALSVTALLNAELPLSMNHIRVGLGNSSLPGRFQLERVGGKTVIMDVAHNPHGIRAFIDNVKQLPAIGDNYLVFAMLNDKSIDQVVTLLDGEVDHWLIAGLDNERALPVAELAQVVTDTISGNFIENTIRKSLLSSVSEFQNVAGACNYALEKMQPNDKLLVVGSFFTVADALMSLKSMNS